MRYNGRVEEEGLLGSGGRRRPLDDLQRGEDLLVLELEAAELQREGGLRERKRVKASVEPARQSFESDGRRTSLEPSAE